MNPLCQTRGWGTVAGILFLWASVRGAENATACRLRIEKDPDSPWPASAGAVDIWPSLACGSTFNVVTSDGRPVHFQTLWAGAGQPTLVRFETLSGVGSYDINFETNAPAPPGAWTAQGGVLLETRTCRPQPVDTLEQISRLMAKAEVQGRSFVPQVFQGINPHGPSADYVALFDGWFTASREGVYEFATISCGASYLQVDGRKVAEWLGRHDPHSGRRGEHSGRLLLKAGAHRLDYVQVQLEGEPAAAAAWKAPGQERFEMIPPLAFLPLARFRVSRFDTAPGAADQIYLEWVNLEHCRVADSLLVKVRFRAVGGTKVQSYKWRFDDGEQASGGEVQHLFVQGGMRQVLVEAYTGHTCVATNSLRVRVHPNWPQREDWRQGLFEEAKRDLLRRDLSQMAARDLTAALELADWVEDTELLSRLGEAMVRRQEEFNSAAYGALFYNLGLSFQHQGDRGNRLAEEALRLALTPERIRPAVADKAKLRIADLLIHCTGDFLEAEKVLGGVALGGLAPEERRLARLLQGDLRLARGEGEEARKQYLAVGNVSTAAASRSDVGRAGVRESASIFLKMGDYERAERTLDRLVFEFPLERMSVNVGLLRLNLCPKRKEFSRAFQLCRALLNTAESDPHKADLLFGVVEAGLAADKHAEAERALRELLKSFPYSEAAARAKELWGEPRSKG